MNLDFVDEAAYQSLKETNPRLVEAIDALLKAGQEPHQIANRVMKRTKASRLLVLSVWGAASYMKAQKGQS